MDCNDSSLIGGPHPVSRCAGRLGAKPPLPYLDEDIILKRIPDAKQVAETERQGPAFRCATSSGLAIARNRGRAGVF